MLPSRFHTVGKYVLLLHIPMVLVFNLLGSFTTLNYRAYRILAQNVGHTILMSNVLGLIRLPQNSQRFGIGVRFTDRNLQMFFNSLALILLVTFQALNFCACFYRLVQAMVDQKRIDSTVNGNDNERHFFNGTGWIALGIKLGAVESIVGFASGDFGLSLTRRILLFLGRACLIIGVVKGSVLY